MDNPFSDSPSKTDAPAPSVAPEAPVEGTENPFENSNKETLATPAFPVVQTPAPTQAPVEEKKEDIPEEGEVVDESGNELLIENDGNVFWIFQKVAWSFLKMAFAVGVIGLLIWIIWRPANNPLNKIHRPINTEESVEKETKKVVPEKKKKPKKEVEKKIEIPVETEVPTASVLVENYAYKAGLWADWMENTRQAQNAQILSRSLYWAKRAEGFFNLTTADLMASEDRGQRAQKIDGTLGALRGILEESKGIVMTLDSELNKASAQSRASEAGMLEADRQLSFSIEVLDGDSAEKLLVEKSRLYQDFVTQNAKVAAYYYTLNRAQSLIPMLQEIHDNILANRQVLIDNVQVVGFPQDKFHRILTPAEWQQMR